ncbi:methionine--tRNA ligase [Bacillus sp. B1-b2]|uniref:methionine--tRNA ligase n=1 Tax=Bacillus sp. B1-b2 TaxID=2653201 RepID=UPI001261997F|nr:methionine--tRNA ligase [Bacillus sp. B1-b2]KAB7673077.1 methionine--tRNA ligase [Bacillus sp. B1-b2]
MSIFIGGAWPYANGSLHLGHVAALLPGDIIARYYRQKGEKVLYVSGSDCNGTPISIRAKQENTDVQSIAERYHQEFEECFKQLGFTYDLYTRTDADHHHHSVKEIFLSLWKNGYLYKKTVEQAYCDHDKQFLPDRFVSGICPYCKSNARGDQCDVCSKILDPLDLLDKTCKICGNEPIIKGSEHFYFAFSKFQEQIEEYVKNAEENELWRDNAISLTKRYLDEGLLDRAVTRDLPNGVDVPLEGFEGKKIYVWIEAVSGYLTASKEWGKLNNQVYQEFWSENTTSYYIHGKDNIPFHTVIWPSILLGLKQKSLPTHIISNEYLTLEKRKLSTSQNWAVWVPYILEKYNPDSVRYFLTINGPENRDTDFSWREFIYSHNGELLGAFGNFVNRTLKFVEKTYQGKIPTCVISNDISSLTKKVYEKTGLLIERGQVKKALEEVFTYIRYANKYFDEEKPWKQIKEEPDKAEETLATCIYIILNLSQLLDPFVPFSTNKIREMLDLKIVEWKEQTEFPSVLHAVTPLFERLDVSIVDMELEYLLTQSNEI